MAASVAAPFVIGAGPARAATAKISIDTARHRGEIDPKIFGNFIEHLAAASRAAFSTKARRSPTAAGFRRGM